MNYKVLAGGITAAFAMWTATRPTLFPNHPYMREIAIFIAAGGLLLLLGIQKQTPKD